MSGVQQKQGKQNEFFKKHFSVILQHIDKIPFGVHSRNT